MNYCAAAGKTHHAAITYTKLAYATATTAAKVALLAFQRWTLVKALVPAASPVIGCHFLALSPLPLLCLHLLLAT